MSKGGAASTIVTAGAVEAMVESIEGAGSAIGVGFGLWRLGSGELGGEVADMVFVGETRRDESCAEGYATRGVRVDP
jgi:hypothetical protein